jgi:hypothetical protein
VDNANYHQVGSVKFAGERYFQCLDESRRWDYQDGIQTGQSILKENRQAKELLDRFMAVAFDFLRTMYAAHSPSGQTKVHLFLVGNGWRLFEAVTREADLQAFKRYFEHLCKSLGFQGLEIYPEDGELNLRKHYVAQGALRNAKDQAVNKPQAPSETSLPAGRKFALDYAQQSVTIPWYQLVGTRYQFPGTVERDLRNGIKDIDVNSGPVKSSSWQNYWNVLFSTSLPAPNPNEIRQWMADGIEGSPPAICRGPLQLLLENWWPRILKEKNW